MKVIAPVLELNCRIHYFDEVAIAYCSIYTVLYNDLMLEWKEPRSLASDHDLAQTDGKEADDNADQE